MISKDNLHQLAIKLQTTEQNVRREYIQHLFLSAFYNQKQSDTIFFKGGTALRLIYGSSRFSEDLDFSATGIKFNIIELIIEQTLFTIGRVGIKTDIIESKKTQGGYFAIIEFAVNQEKVDIQIEISLRDKKPIGETVTVVNDFIPAYVVTALSQSQLIDQKIQALINRKKPRDFYDFYFISRAGLLTVDQRKIYRQIIDILETADIQFDKELKLFLPKNHWSQIRNFKTVLKNEVKKYT